MPLTSLTLTMNLSFALARANAGLGPTIYGPDSESYGWPGVDLTQWNQIYLADLTIAPSTTVTVDLTSLTNLVCEAWTAHHVLSMWVEPTAGEVTIAPGASNGLDWFYGTGMVVDGIEFHSEAVSGSGVVVDGTHKTIEFTNTSSSVPATTIVIIVGSTT